MRGSSSKAYSVFDFDEEEAAVEPASRYLSKKWASPKHDKKVKKEVDLFPDYVFYGDKVDSRSLLTLSSDLIKFEVLSAYNRNESFRFEWAVDDIAYIEFRRSENEDVTYGKIQLRTTSGKSAVNLSDSSAFSELFLVVSDPKWKEKEQIITSFHTSYKCLFKSISAEVVDENDDFMDPKIMLLLKPYFLNFDKPVEEIVYPKGDPDAVCISKRDVELLQPDTFINDTIVDFYIKYMKDRIELKDKNRFHFCNSFFFRKLANFGKDPLRVLEGRSAFLRVRNWTREVNIFGKDYIFIPINFNLHWSLIVVCHPGEIPRFNDETIKKASRVPCILHMDSIKGSHRGLKNYFQTYLWEEWKERHELSEVDSLKFSNLRFIPLELPQQENSFDCGLFLLHYVEMFLKEAPINFNPFVITKYSNFLTPNWFPSVEASRKRSTIHKLISEIIDNHSGVQCSNAADTFPSVFHKRGDRPHQDERYKKCYSHVNKIEKGAETKLFMSAHMEKPCFMPPDKMATKSSPTLCPSVDHEQSDAGSEDALASIHHHQPCGDSSSKIFYCESTNSFEVGISNAGDFFKHSEQEETDAKAKSEKLFPPFPERFPTSLSRDAWFAENRCTSNDEVHVTCNYSRARSNHLSRKRKRFSHLTKYRPRTRSMARALKF